MISFDESTQRLAVGNKQGVIFVYDLASATRLHTLESHSEKPVTAMTFGENGKLLASYCFELSEIKVWRVGTVLFGILNPSVLKTFHVSSHESKWMSSHCYQKNDLVMW
jgi:WD40 repeat protein